MKRLTLLTILLVVVGLTAGALEVKPAFTLSGTGTLEWGIDLDNMDTGFRNTAVADLTVTLMAVDGTDTHAGTGDWYGSITISNVELGFASDEVLAAYITGGALGVSAKIVGMGGKVAIGVVGAPDLALDFVPAVEADEDAEDAVVDNEAELGVDFDGPGTYVSYTMSEALMVGLEFISSNDWTVTPDSYALALDILAKFAPLTINAGVNYGFGSFGEIVGLGVNVAADTAMVDPWVGFDGSLAGTVFGWEVGAGATVTLMETVTAALSAIFDSADNFDLKFVFTEPAEKGLVDNLDATLTVYMLDLLGTLEYEVTLAGGYKTGILYPHFSVTYGDAATPVDLDPTLGLTVGVTADILPLTQFALHYTSADLLGGADMGSIVAGVTVTY